MRGHLRLPVSHRAHHKLASRTERHNAVVAVFDFSRENLQRHVAKHQPPFSVLTDEANQFNKAYHVGRSLSGVLRGMILLFPTLIKLMLMGNLPTTIRGSMTTMPAEFLIDGDGVIFKAYYGKDADDQLPLSKIIKFAKRSASIATTGFSSLPSTQGSFK